MTNTNYFNGVSTLAELKATYKKLAFTFHPDCGGDEETMKDINAEYDEVFATLKTSYNNEASDTRQTTEMAEDYRTIIETLLNLEGIDLELCGNWIWVSGDTKTHKDTLKQLGMLWASKKKMWYWRADQFKSYGRSKSSMQDIRMKYGSTKFTTNERKGLEG